MKNNRIIKILIEVFLASISMVVNAQQQSQFSQYMYNTQMINPGFTGTRGKLDAYFIHRLQWVGLSGAPQTDNLGVSAGIGKIIGLGLNFVNDRLGPLNLSTLTVSVAAKISLSDNLKLSLGLNGGFNIINLDLSKGKSYSDQDDIMLNNVKNKFRPNIGTGIYLYTNHWYVGVAAPNLIQVTRYDQLLSKEVNPKIHLYLMGGYVFDVNSKLKLKPAILIKWVMGAPLTMDLNLNALYANKYTFGLGYRTHDAVDILLGYTIKRCFFIGYAYDINTSKLRHFNSGSHEIILKYTLWGKESGIASPRFF